ncbi:MAG TPA: phenylalanine--tRNA ligase subunit alpha [Thermoplasmata archaeon]|nr:phenylalanine--tRNA ligase subunit alpha [Thermoplasmata archaeon]
MSAQPGGGPPEGDPLLSLSAPELVLLKALREAGQAPYGEGSLSESTGLPLEAVRGSLQRLRAKHLAVAEEEHRSEHRLTPRGREAIVRGLAERRLLETLRRLGRPVPPDDPELAGFSEEERSAAIGILRRRGLLEPGIPLRLADPAAPADELPEEAALRAVSEGAPGVDERLFQQLHRRGLVETDHTTIRRWSASEEGRSIPLAEGSEGIGALTPAMLSSGAWKAHPMRPYDVRAPVPRVQGARPHPYLAWLREFEEILIGLGFVEASGPLVESEFWNSDVLFMPQEHPARSIHDVLALRDVEATPPDEGLLERVAAAHEGRPLPGHVRAISSGWRSPYDPSFARRTLLRSQTTAVSARFLATRPTPPFRMYCIDRNFRRDSVDATHHVEFGQCEGVLGEEGISLRHLVGVFRSLAAAIGIRELKIRPSYFPFTEPSIEGYVRHPRLGWIEVFPGGIFRPEVTRPLGIEVPVAAWGIGVTRLAMVALGVSDIRELYMDDLERLRRSPP